MLAGVPLSITGKPDPRAAHQKDQRSVRPSTGDPDGQGLLAAAQRRVVRHGQVRTRKPQERPRHADGLAKRQREQNLDGKAQLDRHVREGCTPARLARSLRKPPHLRIDRDQPRTTPLRRGLAWASSWFGSGSVAAWSSRPSNPLVSPSESWNPGLEQQRPSDVQGSFSRHHGRCSPRDQSDRRQAGAIDELHRRSAVPHGGLGRREGESEAQEGMTTPDGQATALCEGFRASLTSEKSGERPTLVPSASANGCLQGAVTDLQGATRVRFPPYPLVRCYPKGGRAQDQS